MESSSYQEGLQTKARNFEIVGSFRKLYQIKALGNVSNFSEELTRFWGDLDGEQGGKKQEEKGAGLLLVLLSLVAND